MVARHTLVKLRACNSIWYRARVGGPPCVRTGGPFRVTPLPYDGEVEMAKRAYGSAWQRVLRPMILERDGYVCKIRGPRCKGRATTVDHIVEVADGGTNHPSNLRAACLSCNASRGAAFGNRRREPRSVNW